MSFKNWLPVRGGAEARRRELKLAVREGHVSVLVRWV